MRFWLAFAVAPLSAMALACSTTEAVGLPDDSGPEAAAHDATTNDSATPDATVDAADGTAQDSASPDATDAGASSDAGDAAAPADASDEGTGGDACVACDGGMCCAPLVCRASGNCSTCLGSFESCGGQQDCCSHACEGGLCL
jgi:hypothetical protein